MKKSSTVFLGTVLCFGLTTEVHANSAQTYWEGTDSNGVKVLQEDCPLIVEHEQLDFHIEQFPDPFQFNQPELDGLSYVTAEYVFYNPADYTVDATLVFPFGTTPDYAKHSDLNSNRSSSGYRIQVNGQPIEVRIRHTLSLPGMDFDPDSDIAKLRDDFTNDAFYSPQMPVTRYTYTCDSIDASNSALTAAFEVESDSAKTKVLMEQMSGYALSDGKARISTWANYNEIFVVDVIGETTQEPNWKFYTDGSCEEETEGTMELVSTETTTLKDLLMESYDPSSLILDYDYYNAKIDLLNLNELNYAEFGLTQLEFDDTCLMRWYEYSIKLEPNERMTNSVTAPMYPSVDQFSEPPVYTYTYLLSPAASWASFGPLDITVDTPFEIVECTLGNTKVTLQDKQLHLDGLPDGELIFTLSTDANPTRKHSANAYNSLLSNVLIGAGILFILFVLAKTVRTKKH